MKRGTTVIAEAIVTVLLAAGNVVLGGLLFKATKGSEKYEIVDEEEFRRMKDSGVIKER